MDKARELLKSDNILKRVIRDMDILGYVGEEENKVLGYLIAISRKLDQPLSGIVVSSSGAGKSRLVDTLERLIPPEDVVFTSRLTSQSLYYMQKDFLRHKLLIVEERHGSELADYPIRTLQSKGSLSLAIPVKNRTVFFEVKGPVSILETTVSCKLNLENTSRCFILHLDESEEQTRLIHRYQRQARTKERLKLQQKAQGIIRLHQDMQRLIKPCAVIIPYANKLTFPANSPSSRREHQKFLTLIEAIALLYQYQRRKIVHNGLVFIESAIQDYEIAFDIFSRVYRDTLFMHHSKSAVLLAKILRLKRSVFSREDIANFSGWPNYKVRDNIRYLEEAGILMIIRNEKGKRTLYKLNSHLKLTKPEELRKRGASTT